MATTRRAGEPTPSMPIRKKPAHGVFAEPNKPVLVFVTVCTWNREPWLATDAYHALLREVWCAATFWRVGRYVLMPDHMHFFVAEYEPDFPFASWMRHWRAQFACRNPIPRNRLQTDYWDRRLRSSESYAEKWEYVRQNPVRRGLARAVDEWPYQGEITELNWWG